MARKCRSWILRGGGLRWRSEGFRRGGAEKVAENTMRIKRAAIVLAFVGLLFGQDAAPAPEKKGGGRGPRPKPPGVSTPGVKREMSTITPAAVYSIPGTPD